MGNRASISVEGSNQTIFVHWNGGKGSIMAFVREANRRCQASKYEPEKSNDDLLTFDDNENLDPDVYMIELYSAIRQFFSFSGEQKHRGRDSLSLRIFNSIQKNDEDNKHYHVNGNGSIDFSGSKLIENQEYTEGCFKDITSFFKQADNLLLTSDFD